MQAQLQSQQMQIAEFQQREQEFQQRLLSDVHQVQALTPLQPFVPTAEKTKSRVGRRELSMLSDSLARAHRAANQAFKVAGDVKAMVKSIEGWELGKMSFFCMVHSGVQLQMHCFGE